MAISKEPRSTYVSITLLTITFVQSLLAEFVFRAPRALERNDVISICGESSALCDEHLLAISCTELTGSTSAKHHW